MSSEMFPFATHPDYYENYDIEQFRSKLAKLGEYAKQCGQRLTFHPGQYNQLTSINNSVVIKSIIDIDFHAKILDMMNVDKNGIIIIHGGSKQDGKENSLTRLEKNFYKLSTSAQKRLTLENCEMVYSIQDLLPLSYKLQIPIIVDIHHHNINQGTEKIDVLIKKVLVVWKQRDIIPLFHISESKPGVKITDSITTRRAHSDFVKVIPPCFLDLVHSEMIFVDIEAKQKEQAVLQLFKKYNYL
jgi:UV DNA damage endonuclease